MKHTKPSTKLTGRKLALKREILRQLTSTDLGRVQGGTCGRDIIDPRECLNPIYSA